MSGYIGSWLVPLIRSCIDLNTIVINATLMTILHVNIIKINSVIVFVRGQHSDTTMINLRKTLSRVQPQCKVI
jgi:hypothetical protein